MQNYLNRILTKSKIAYCCALLCPLWANADSLELERIVRANSIVSEQDPRIRIEVPETSKYIGGHRWLLFDVADCEVHVFVEADSEKRVSKYYWIQFEAYLPSVPNGRYNYTKGHNEIIDGLEFNLRARCGPTSEKPQPGSDYERVRMLIREAGYTLPADMMNVRFVHLYDDSKRKEVLAFYTEDMAFTGYTFADLFENGEMRPEWTPIETGLIERAKERIRFRSDFALESE